MEKKTLKTYQITINSEPEEIESIKQMFDIIKVKEIKKTRTLTQNNSLHLWFSQIAEALNEKHFDMRTIIRDEIAIEWSGYNVKEYLFRPLMKAKFGKKSTTQLFKSGEIDDIIDIITKVIAERTNGEVGYIPFPSIVSINNFS